VKARDLDYDLALAGHRSSLPSVRDAGVEARQVRAITPPSPSAWSWVLGVLLAIATWAAGASWLSARSGNPSPGSFVQPG
jgi:hypothetical protein